MKDEAFNTLKNSHTLMHNHLPTVHTPRGSAFIKGGHGNCSTSKKLLSVHSQFTNDKNTKTQTFQLHCGLRFRLGVPSKDKSAPLQAASENQTGNKPAKQSDKQEVSKAGKQILKPSSLLTLRSPGPQIINEYTFVAIFLTMETRDIVPL